MKMQKRDWYDYVAYLRGELKTANLQEPLSVGESYNNFQNLQDLEDVKLNKIGVAKDSAKG